MDLKDLNDELAKHEDEEPDYYPCSDCREEWPEYWLSDGLCPLCY